MLGLTAGPTMLTTTFIQDVLHYTHAKRLVNTRGHTYKGIIGPYQGYFTNKYLSIWDHMKALTILFHMRYGSLLSSMKWLSDRPKCWGHMVEAGTTQAKTVSKTTVLEWWENKGYLNLSACHWAVSQSWASYHTSSERGESELSADPKILNFFKQKAII